jgi:hypothetical protein
LQRLFALTGAISLFFALTAIPLIGGTILYDIHVNTSAVSGTGGAVEIQVSAGLPGDPLISATISHFSLNGSLVGSPTNLGNVSGALPGTVTIDNGNTSFALASMYQQITYGSGFNFRLTIDTVAIDPGPPLVSLPLLAIYLYDASDMPILTTDPFGSILVWETDSLRNPLVSTFPSDANESPSVVTINDVPEPATLSLLAAGIAVLWWRRRMTV